MTLDALMTVPAGGWDTSVDDGGGAATATLTAGDRYSGDVCTDFAAVLDSATGQTFTVSIDPDTGFCTISVASGTFTLSWTDTDLRDYLGFAGNLTPAAALFTGTLGCQGLWCPNCPVDGDDLQLDKTGNLRTDARYSRSPTGKTLLFVGNSYRSFRNVRWTHVADDRALDEIGSYTSWQGWVKNTQFGGLSYFPIVDGVPPTVLAVANPDDGTLLGESAGGDGIYRLVLAPDLTLPRSVEGWTGLYNVTIPEMIKV